MRWKARGSVEGAVFLNDEDISFKTTESRLLILRLIQMLHLDCIYIAHVLKCLTEELEVKMKVYAGGV